MEKVIKRYLAKFDEIDRFKGVWLNTLPSTFEEFINIVNEHLEDGYLEGYASVGYMLKDDVNRQPDIAKIIVARDKIVAGENINDRLRAYFESHDVEAIMAVFTTEYHRMYNTGAEDRAKDVEKTLVDAGLLGILAVGSLVQKKWVTVGDDKVRDTHISISGQTVPLSESFVANDGDTAMFPGGFSKPQNNVNCRCTIEYTLP